MSVWIPNVKETLTGFARVRSHDGHMDLRRSSSARRAVSFTAGSFAKRSDVFTSGRGFFAIPVNCANVVFYDVLEGLEHFPLAELQDALRTFAGLTTLEQPHESVGFTAASCAAWSSTRSE